MPYIELINPDDPGCPYSWGKLLGKETCLCHRGQDKYEHECMKQKGHKFKHQCAHCGQKVNG